MSDIDYVMFPREALERIRDYIDAATDEAGVLSAPEVDNILAALDEALA